MQCPLCLEKVVEQFAQTQSRTFFRCRECALIFVDKADFPSREQELERYLHHRNDETNEEYRTYLESLLQPLVEKIEAASTGLDYGCGPTKMVEILLRKKGMRISSFDPLFFPDAKPLDQQYDFIFCAEVAEHFHNPRHEFARLDGLLKTGGWLELVTGLYRESQAFSDWWYIRDFTHVVFYSERTLEWITRKFRWECEFRDGNITLFSKKGQRQNELSG